MALAPIRHFGEAAERLGRNPRATPLSLDGPAEIREAAEAFNEMTERISRYVDDRVAMMAAIAHDLRTPLTRLSFRLERAPDDIRCKGEADIAEMMGMLAAELAFVQSTQAGRPRRQQELRSLLTSSADDQADMGRDVTVEEGPDIVLVGDDQGLRSLSPTSSRMRWPMAAAPASACAGRAARRSSRWRTKAPVCRPRSWSASSSPSTAPSPRLPRPRAARQDRAADLRS